MSEVEPGFKTPKFRSRNGLGFSEITLPLLLFVPIEEINSDLKIERYKKSKLSGIELGTFTLQNFKVFEE